SVIGRVGKALCADAAFGAAAVARANTPSSSARIKKRIDPPLSSIVRFFKSYLFSQAHAKRAAVAARVPRWPKFDQRQCKIPVSPENVRKRGRPMPTETVVIVLTISAIFALFAGSLAWADVYSRGSQKP